MSDIQLGNLVRDVVTGFEGIVTSRLESIDGTTDYGVRAPYTKSEGKRPGPEYICSNQLEKIGDGITIKASIRKMGFNHEK